MKHPLTTIASLNLRCDNWKKILCKDFSLTKEQAESVKTEEKLKELIGRTTDELLGYPVPERGRFVLVKGLEDLFLNRDIGRYTPVDTPIAPLIKYLNRKGIKTKACCAGHPETRNDRIGYIYFNYGDKTDSVVKKAANILLNTEGILVSLEDGLKGPTIRFTPRSSCDHTFMIKSLERAFGYKKETA